MKGEIQQLIPRMEQIVLEYHHNCKVDIEEIGRHRIEWERWERAGSPPVHGGSNCQCSYCKVE